MKTSKKNVKKDPGGIAFDGDTDTDSDDENIQTFNSSVSKISESVPHPPDENSDESEDISDGEEQSSSEIESDSEEDLISTPDNKLSDEKKDKLSKLQEQLAGMSNDKDSSDESSDSEDVNENADITAHSNKVVFDGKDTENSDNQDFDSDAETPELTKTTKRPLEASDTMSANSNKKVKDDITEMTSEERARSSYRDKLSKMSLDEIQDIKERLGLKLFNQKLSGTAPVRGKKVEFRRDNKNKPREMSSKKTVGRFREVVQTAKVVKRDPRFDPLCGEFDDKLFKESYQFVNEIKSNELVDLKKQIRKEEDPEKRKQIKYLIQRTENQLRSEAQIAAKREVESAERNERIEQLKAGVKPVYLSKSKQKETQLVEQFEKLKESGGLDNYIRKKTKKNLVKDRKKFENL